jgi:hypothetical protein
LNQNKKIVIFSSVTEFFTFFTKYSGRLEFFIFFTIYSDRLEFFTFFENYSDRLEKNNIKNAKSNYYNNC